MTCTKKKKKKKKCVTNRLTDKRTDGETNEGKAICPAYFIREFGHKNC